MRPSAAEIDAVAAEFGLHGLAVEDTIKAHQRPKLERYGEVEFVVLRPARYVDPVEVVEIGEVHVFLGPDFVITVRHAQEPDLAEVRHRLEADPDLLDNGPYAVLYAVMDKIVDDYGPVLEGLQVDIDEIEVQVFDGDPNASKRIYTLSREVIEFQRVDGAAAWLCADARRVPGRRSSSNAATGIAAYTPVVIFFFGLGTKQQHLGPGDTRTCPRCHNTTRWTRIREFKQFTVFFVPVARWKRRQLEICGICGAAIEV